MYFNYMYNRNKMEQEYAEISSICRDNGVPEETIGIIYRLMLNELNSDRRFYSHTQSYDRFQITDGNEVDEGRSPLLARFQDQISAAPAEICELGRMAWVEDIDTPEIAMWLRSLDEGDILMLTLIVADGMKQTEVAKILGKHDSAISRKMKRLRKSLKKVLPKRLKNDWLKKAE